MSFWCCTSVSRWGTDFAAVHVLHRSLIRMLWLGVNEFTTQPTCGYWHMFSLMICIIGQRLDQVLCISQILYCSIIIIERNNSTSYNYFFFYHGAMALVGQGLLIVEDSWSHSNTTVGRHPLDEWSAQCRDLYQTTYNTHKRQTSLSPVGFEPTIPASEWPQTHALDRTPTGINSYNDSIL